MFRCSDVNMKFKRGKQVPTAPTTIAEIMNAPEFALGVADARAGRPMHQAFDAWDGNRQWNYERGRQWARLAPGSVMLKRNGKVTPQAIRHYTEDIL